MNYEEKVSRTVDCAKSIKRRSIKFLNTNNEQRISRSRVSILNEMDSRCLIVTPEIMRQIQTSKEALDSDTPAETAENTDKLPKELIKVSHASIHYPIRSIMATCIFPCS